MIDVYQGLFNVKTKNLQIINHFPDPTCCLIIYIIMCKNQRINLQFIDKIIKYLPLHIFE